MMRFNDFRLLSGRIESRWVHETDKLAPIAVETCRDILRELRQHGGQVEHGVDGLPRFAVSLNAPAFLIDEMGETVEAPDRLFCVQQPGKDPFQINLVLPETPAPIDGRVAATLLGISLLGSEARSVNESETLERIQEILDARPVLATAMIPVTLDPRTLSIAADFSTCFAAAMLTTPDE